MNYFPRGADFDPSSEERIQAGRRRAQPSTPGAAGSVTGLRSKGWSPLEVGTTGLMRWRFPYWWDSEENHDAKGMPRATKCILSADASCNSGLDPTTRHGAADLPIPRYSELFLAVSAAVPEYFNQKKGANKFAPSLSLSIRDREPIDRFYPIMINRSQSPRGSADSMSRVPL